MLLPLWLILWSGALSYTVVPPGPPLPVVLASLKSQYLKGPGAVDQLWDFLLLITWGSSQPAFEMVACEVMGAVWASLIMPWPVSVDSRCWEIRMVCGEFWCVCFRGRDARRDISVPCTGWLVISVDHSASKESSYDRRERKKQTN